MADLEYDVTGHVGTILLNRPQVRNAFTLDMLEDWTTCLAEAAEDPRVRVLVVRGAGGAFCSGIDLATVRGQLGGTPAEHTNIVRRRIQNVPLSMETFDKPVIASVSGPAVGAGLDLALMCDMRLASISARFRMGYINAGLLPGEGGAYYLPRLVGYARAFEMLLGGEFVDADEALRIGLVNRVHDDDRLLEATYELAEHLAGKPPVVAELMKRTLRRSAAADLATSLDLVSAHMGLIRDDDEATRAFVAVRERTAQEQR